MQKKLQQFQNTFLRKQSNKLSLQLKLSLINSTYLEFTQTRSPKHNQSPTTKYSANVQSFQTTDRQEIIDSSVQQTEQRVQKLQHQLDKQFIIITKFKQILKQRSEEYHNMQLSRQKYMKELTLKRKIQIQTLKRQINLAIKCTIEQREYFFHKLESQFNKSLHDFFSNWKSMKKLWKRQLKFILQKFQGQTNTINTQIISNSSKKQLINYPKTSLKDLQNQLKNQILSSQKQSLQIQLQLNTLIQNFNQKRQEMQHKFNNNFLQILEQVQKLEKNIKSEVKREHLESEQNREKLLFLFEENVDKIQNKQAQKQRQRLNKFKPQKLVYRHLV